MNEIKSIVETREFNDKELGFYLLGETLNYDDDKLYSKAFNLDKKFEDKYTALDTFTKDRALKILAFYYRKFYNFLISKEMKITRISYNRYSLFFIFNNEKVLAINFPYNVLELIESNDELKNVYLDIFRLIRRNSSRYFYRPISIRVDYCFDDFACAFNDKYLDVLGTLTLYRKGDFLNGRNGVYDVSKDFVNKFNLLNDMAKKEVISRLVTYYNDVYEVIKNDRLSFDKFLDDFIIIYCSYPINIIHLFYPSNIDRLVEDYPELNEVYLKLKSLS